MLRPSPRWHLAAVAAASVLVYANSLGNAFVWDDLHLVVDNPTIKSWGGFWSLWTSDLFPTVASRYYRPAQALTYWLDYRIWALTPFGYHLTSMLLHAGAALLLYRLIDRLLGVPRAALLGALLFAVHPLNTEAVTYISGRSDPLSAVLMLAALVAFLEGDGRRFGAWHVGSLVAFAGALLAREAAVVLVPLIVLVDLTVSRRDGEPLRGSWGRRTLRYLPYVGVLALALGARALAVGLSGTATALAAVPWPLRLGTMLEVIVRYVALLLAPIGLHMERTVTPARSLLEPSVLGAALVGAGGVVVAVVCWRRAWPVTFGIAWFLIALVPVSNVVPLATFMAEHWLYVPSMGWFLVLGWSIDRLLARPAWRPAVAALAAVVLLVYGGLTVRRNMDWKDGVTLYEATLRHAPESVRAYINLGEALQRLGQLDRAEAAYRKALTLDPTSWVPHSNLGSIYSSQGRPDLAEEAYRRAQDLDPRMGAAHNNLGNLYRSQRRPDDAVREFKQALAINPSDAAAHNNLGLALLDLGRPEDARAEFEAAIRINPDYAAAHSNLGNYHFRRSQFAEAAEHYRAALRRNPDFAQAHNNLGSVYVNMGRLDDAEEEYRRALALDPSLGEVRRNLEVVMKAKARATQGPGASR